MSNLTPSQLNALKALSGLDHPTLQDWADQLGHTVSAVQVHKRALIAAGFVESSLGRSRSTKITAAGKRYLKKAGM